MPTSPEVRSSRVQFDGALVLHHPIGRSALATAAVDNIGGFIAPCDLTIQQVLIHVLASSTSSNAQVAIGNASASGAYRGAYSLQNKAAGTIINLPVAVATSAFTKITLSKGDYLKLKTKAATAAGAFAASIVFAPTTGVA